MAKPEFTKEQKQAIESRDSNVLVSASAGSGKTAVLVDRIISRVLDKENPCNIDEFLVVTFTNAAARQMKEKISEAFAELAESDTGNPHLIKQLALVNKADITTIDSFCLKVVRENFYLLGIDSSFGIMDDKLMDILKSDVLDSILEEEYEKLAEIKKVRRKSDSKEALEKSGMELLLDIFGKTNDDTDVKNIILKCVAQSNSIPNPDEWYENALKSIMINSAEDLNATVWIKKYMEHIRKAAVEIREKILMCVDITNRPDGCGSCINTISDELNKVDAIIGANSYDEMVNAAKMEVTRISAVRKAGPEKDNYLELKAIRDTYSEFFTKLKKELISGDKILEEAKLIQSLIGTIFDICKRFTEKLDHEKAKKKQYEFSDISHMALKVLSEGHAVDGSIIPSKTGKVIAERYKEIYIDEYQDSNFLQEDILTACSRRYMDVNNIFMVGDVKQSIYRFRQARPELFTDKFDSYEETDADDKDNRLIILKENFRSRDIVLDGINAVFEKIMHRDMGGIEYDGKAFLVNGKKFEETDANISKDTEIYVITKRGAEDANAAGILDGEDDTLKLQYEAKLACDRIKDIVDPENGLDIWDDKKKAYRKATYRDCMILLRSVKGRGAIIAETLSQYGIPVVLDNPNGYFDALEVTTMLSVLKIIDNSRQDIPLAAVLMSEIGGLDESKLVVVSEMLKDNKDANLYDKCQFFIEEYENSEDEYRNIIAGELKLFFDRLLSWKKDRPYLSIAMLIKRVLDDTGYDIYVSGLSDGKRRIANIHMLIEKATLFEKGEFRGLFNFLRYMEKIRIHDVDFGEAMMISESENVIRITTMHKSKGLEYPVVFLMDMGGNFNDRHTKENITIDADYFLSMRYYDMTRRIKRKSGMQKIIHKLITLDNLSEEQRVLYVAMTRAKEKLIMIGTVSKLDSVPCNIDYSTRSSARNYYDWVLPAAILGNGTGLFALSTVYLDQIDFAKAAFSYTQKESYDKVKKLLTNSDEEMLKNIDDIYGFEYEYEDMSKEKGKMSVSEIKKLKMLIHEVDIKKKEEKKQELKKVLNEKGTAGAVRGTVIHKLMELMPFKDISSKEEYVNKIDELLALDFFTESERNIKGKKSVYDFYDSPLFARLKAADERGSLERERRYTMGYNPEELFKKPDGHISKREEDDLIVVQGEIDVYFIEDGKAILLDYKTDSVDNSKELVERYYAQLECYADAIRKLTGLEVTEKLIYSFKLNETIDVTDELIAKIKSEQ